MKSAAHPTGATASPAENEAEGGPVPSDPTERPLAARRLLTTAEAAAYCGFKTTGALRKARLEGRVAPAGRRMEERMTNKTEWMQMNNAMAYLGLITGLRPSTLRPLRRRGPECDVDWNEHRLRVRRSHTVGEEVMRTTKQKHRYTIGLPPEAMHVLQWHVDTQLRTPEQEESDSLFPGIDGGFRSTSVLLKPFAEVAREVGLTKRVTPRALRRTFNDLARAAQVQDIVTRSISGHLTEDMQRHYSTVSGDEQRQALAKVIDLTRTAADPDRRAGGGQQAAACGQQAAGSGQQAGGTGQQRRAAG